MWASGFLLVTSAIEARSCELSDLLPSDAFEIFINPDHKMVSEIPIQTLKPNASAEGAQFTSLDQCFFSQWSRICGLQGVSKLRCCLLVFRATLSRQGSFQRKLFVQYSATCVHCIQTGRRRRLPTASIP